MSDPAPTFFVARDRARNFARRIRDTLQERRLAYRGADVGMTSHVNEAQRALQQFLDEAAETVADIDAGRIRDRERGYMEVPLVVMAESIAERARLAQQIDRALDLGGISARSGRAVFIALLEDALTRIDAFTACYDDKQPVEKLRTTDLAHRLDVIEDEATWRRRLATGDRSDPAAYDRRPPDLPSAPDALDDVLRAARAMAPGVPGPWHIDADDAEGVLRMRLGPVPGDTPAIEGSERLARALELLAFRQPVQVRCYGTAATAPGLLSPSPESEADAGDTAATLEVLLPMPVQGAKEITPESLVGADATLSAEAERAFRALQQAPPVGPDGTPPPPRAVAWMGLMRAVDQELKRVVVARCRSNACRVVVDRLPRESTRKAPLLRAVVEALVRSFDGFPEGKVGAIANELSAGKVASSRARPADAAVVLALVGRTWSVGNAHLPRAMVLAPLDEREVNLLIGELCQLARARTSLEGGEAMTPATVRSMEQSAVAALARLGQVGG